MNICNCGAVFNNDGGFLYLFHIVIVRIEEPFHLTCIFCSFHLCVITISTFPGDLEDEPLM